MWRFFKQVRLKKIKRSNNEYLSNLLVIGLFKNKIWMIWVSKRQKRKALYR